VRQDLRREQVQVVEVVEVEHLEVHARGARVAVQAMRSSTSCGVPAAPPARSCSAG
jgi:hypothetical protein